jgi:predicted nucleic acid-binding protein
MRKLIVDTSIIIALISSDEERSIIMQAIANYKMVCSISVYAEVGNAISAMFKRGRITLIQAHEMLNSFKQLQFETYDINLPMAIEISYQYKIYAYDAYVLECAKRLNLPLVTLDKLMIEKAKELNITTIEV